MSSRSEEEERRDQQNRPTLPPIRDLFGEELAHSPRPYHLPTSSPSFSLSRLRVSDDEENHPSQSESSLMGPGSLSYLPGPPPRVPSSIHRHPSHTHLAFFHQGSNASTPTLPLAALPPTTIDPPHSHPTPYSTDYYSGHPAQYQTAGAPPFRRSISMAPMQPQQNLPSRGGSPYDPRGYRHSDTEQGPPRHQEHQYAAPPAGPSRSALDSGNTPPAPRYECSYCGKGFNRPSSLKIHLNSHTGEKPFVCPVEGCGRSFSVLSNMRRHARVHTQSSRTRREGSSDEGSDGPQFSMTGSSGSPLTPAEVSPSIPSGSGTQHVRQGSNASSAGSQTRIRGSSPEDQGHLGKRNRIQQGLP